jgi:hypothetical protein
MYALHTYRNNRLLMTSYAETFEEVQEWYEAQRNHYFGEDVEFICDFEELDPIYLVPVHMCPPISEWVTLCCGRSPYELLAHRMTQNSSLVTCKGR